MNAACWTMDNGVLAWETLGTEQTTVLSGWGEKPRWFWNLKTIPNQGVQFQPWADCSTFFLTGGSWRCMCHTCVLTGALLSSGFLRPLDKMRCPVEEALTPPCPLNYPHHEGTEHGRRHDGSHHSAPFLFFYFTPSYLTSNLHHLLLPSVNDLAFLFY